MLFRSQPYIGKLYKSQNASTWIPSPNQDLKFKLYRAKFTNTNTGIQYRWTGSEWVKSVEGLYRGGEWSIII